MNFFNWMDYWGMNVLSTFIQEHPYLLMWGSIAISTAAASMCILEISGDLEDVSTKKYKNNQKQ